MTDSDADRDPVEQLAEDFLAKYRSGNEPDVREYIDKFPEYADQIGDLFPTLMLMEKFCPVAQESNASSQDLRDNRQLEGEFGEYQILRRVGQGGMGVVYEAIHRSLDRRVALKILPNTRFDGDVARKRFFQEARAAASLHHTNIVPVFDVGEQDDIPYFAMQFIEGRSLAELVHQRRESRLSSGAQNIQTINARSDDTRRKSTAGDQSGKDDGSQEAVTGKVQSSDENENNADHSARDNEWLQTKNKQQYFQSIAEIGVQIADAIAFVHEKGILHRDIKPSNLILDSEERVWTTDFGLAKSYDVDDLTQTGRVVGTMRYMPPERFQGISAREGDIYSLGATLYELLCEQPAFSESDRVRLSERIQNDAPPSPRQIEPQIPVDLETIVLKAMEKDPRRRYLDGKALAEDLRRWLNHEPISTRPISMAGRVVRWSQRKPLVASLVLSLAIITLAGFSLVTWKWLEAERNRELANINAERAQQVVHDFYSEVSKSWGLLHLTPRTQQLRKTLLEKAEKYYIRFLIERKTSATEYQLAHANYCLGDIFLETGDYGAAEPYYRRAIESLEKLLKGDPDQNEYSSCLAKCYSGLAQLLSKSNRIKLSIEFNSKALLIFGKFNKADPDATKYANHVGSVRNNLGTALMLDGKFDLAADEFREAIRVREKIKDPGFSIQKGLAISYRKQGDLMRLNSQNRKALELYQKSLKLLGAIRSENPNIDWIEKDFCATSIVLGSVLRKLGDFQKAADVYQLGTDAIRKVVENNPDVPGHRSLLAKALNNLAHAENSMGMQSIATERLEEAIKIWRKLVESNPESAAEVVGLASCLQNLSLNYRRAGELKKSNQMIREAIELREKICQQDPTADCRNDLAEAYCQLGSSMLWNSGGRNLGDQEASELFRKAIEIGKSLVNEHPRISKYKNSLAEAYIHLGKQLTSHISYQASNNAGSTSKKMLKQKVQAEESLKQAIAILEGLIKIEPGNQDLYNDLALARLNLGICHQRIGNTERAFEQMKLAAEIWKKASEINPDATTPRLELITCYNTIGFARYLNNQSKQALESYEKAVEIGRKLRTKHNRVRQFKFALADCYDKMAAVYQSQRNAKLARKNLALAVEATRNIEPQYLTHQQTKVVADRCSRLAKFYLLTDEAPQKIGLLETAIALRTRQVQNSPDRRDCKNELAVDQNNLGLVYMKQRKLDLAARHFDAAVALRSTLDQETALDWELKGLAVSHWNLATIRRMQNQIKDALSHLEQAAELRRSVSEKSPDDLSNKSSLASVFTSHAILERQLKNSRSAINGFAESLRINRELARKYPKNPQYAVNCFGSEVNLALANRDLMKFREALEMLENAECGLSEVLASQESTTAENYLKSCRLALNNTHEMFARHLIAHKRDRKSLQAVFHARRACELSSWKNSTYLQTLAFVSASAGDFEKAVKYQSQALEHADDRSIATVRQRLEQYRLNQLPSGQ